MAVREERGKWENRGEEERERALDGTDTTRKRTVLLLIPITQLLLLLNY